MRPRAWLRAAVVLLLLAERPAQATTTFSAPVRNSEGDSLACFVQNHGSFGVEVATVLRDESGAALDTFSFDVLPGRAFSLTNSSAPVSGGYCEFEFDGDDAAVRGFIRLTDAAGSNTRLLYPAAEVRGAPRPDVVTYSPPVLSGPDDLVACVVQNLSDAPVQVTAQLRNSIDALVAETTLHVAAGQVTTLVSATDPAMSTYCKFTFDGNPVEVRGYVRISGAMGGNTRFLAPASESHEAATSPLYTPAVATTGGAVRCAAQNLGDATVLVDAELLDADGVLIDAAAAMLPPGNVEYVVNSTEESTAPVSCRFTFGVKQHRVQTFLVFTEPAGGGTRLLQPATATGGPSGINATSFTAAVRNVEGSDLECWALNLSAAPVAIAAALLDNTGSLMDSQQATIDAGHTRRLLTSTQSVLGAYCRFVFDGSPADVRGFLVLNDGTPRLLETASIAQMPIPLLTATPTRTATPAWTATPTETETRTPSHTPSATGTPTATSTPSAAPTATATRTVAGSPTATATSTLTATAAASGSPTPTTYTASPSATASTLPTEASTPQTATPSATPSQTPPPATAGTPTETAIVSPTGSPAPGAPGDANCDGVVSAADVVAVIGVIDSGVSLGCGEDANEDGRVDEADLNEILGLIFG